MDLQSCPVEGDLASLDKVTPNYAERYQIVQSRIKALCIPVTSMIDLQVLESLKRSLTQIAYRSLDLAEVALDILGHNNGVSDFIKDPRFEKYISEC